jgi:sporulation protein YlmC with PRC-barrel domain
MKKSLTVLTAFCAAGLITGVQAQNSSDSSATPGSSTKQSPSSGLSPGAAADQSTTPSGHSSSDTARPWSGRSGSLSATGRSGSQDVRASKLMGAEIKGSTGSGSLGTINDVIINPASGRIDFAVISLSASGASGSTGLNSSTSSSTDNSNPGSPSSASSRSRNSSSFGTTGSSVDGKLVALPWHLLRPAGSASSGSATTTIGSSTAGSEVSFVFAGDPAKLQAAPTFDQNSWPDFSQPTWRQSIYSYFGMTPGSSTGGATSPGGTGSSTIDSSSSTSPNSSSSQNPASSPDTTGSSSKP